MIAALEAGGFRYRNAVNSPVARLAGRPGFDSWLAAKSKSFRYNLRHSRKLLDAMGPITFRQVETKEDGQRLVSWLLATKRAALARRGVDRNWVWAPQAEQVFAALIGSPAGNRAGFLGFTLHAGETLVAGSLCMRAGPTLEYLVTGYAPEFDRYAPGHLLLEHLFRWCVRERLDFDFRITHEPYKLRWIDDFEPRATILLACTPRGVPYVLKPILRRAARRARDAWRARRSTR
jgi:CelD/BcsL family acetyltransferase involved in cellulose biosynthesis